jgi:hypothetical protein
MDDETLYYLCYGSIYIGVLGTLTKRCLRPDHTWLEVGFSDVICARTDFLEWIPQLLHMLTLSLTLVCDS